MPLKKGFSGAFTAHYIQTKKTDGEKNRIVFRYHIKPVRGGGVLFQKK